ncbi:MAG: carboxylating nicotinate-nucleotide diphosphorylase [Thiotrichales bacterium]|nr:carboxylating nicotinate-nucleotide diphosphorylase [Thiotrichales bacterium]
MDFFETLSATVKTALKEDIQTGDLTAGLIPEANQATATILCRENAVICGRPWFDEVFKQIDPTITLEWQVTEGQKVAADTLLCTATGSARNILTAERTALNFLQTLSATASVSAQYVAQLGDSKTKLLDTRKTLPNLRLAQKYAVKCGGGTNHRIGLFDAILIKENHIMAAGGIKQAVETAKNQHPDITVEVETENLDEVMQAVDAGADIIMLDNFTLQDMHAAVKQVNGRAKLEVSGNVEIEHLAELAKTGVDFISTGAITKHVRAIDLSMRFVSH